jgi:hypothetical protein
VQAVHRVAQRLGFLLGQAPELFVASARIAAAARARAQASFVAAMAKRSEQAALRALARGTQKEVEEVLARLIREEAYVGTISALRRH